MEFIETNQLFGLSAVVETGRGEGGLKDEFELDVYPDMGFVIKVVPSAFFGRVGIGIDLRGGILIQHPAFFSDSGRPEEGGIEASTMVPFLTINPLAFGCSLISLKMRWSRL
jgi:hypothetical protein